MTTLKFRSQVGEDGILHLDVPVCSVTKNDIYANAYYSRGLIHKRNKNIEKAISDLYKSKLSRSTQRITRKLIFVGWVEVTKPNSLMCWVSLHSTQPTL